MSIRDVKKANGFLDSLDDFIGEPINEAKEESVNTDLGRKRDDLYKKIPSLEKLVKAYDKIYADADKLREESMEYESPMFGSDDCIGMLKGFMYDAEMNKMKTLNAIETLKKLGEFQKNEKTIEKKELTFIKKDKK